MPNESKIKLAATDHPILPVLAKRWSRYGFDGRAVAADDLRSLFEAARWAPSSFNEQPWFYLVATSPCRIRVGFNPIAASFA